MIARRDKRLCPSCSPQLAVRVVLFPGGRRCASCGYVVKAPVRRALRPAVVRELKTSETEVIN